MLLKSQLLYFSYLDKDHSDLLCLNMKDGNVIPYVSKCLHLGTTIYTMLYRDNVINVVNELYNCTNYLLSDFSFTESCTVSNLFNSFCMNSYTQFPVGVIVHVHQKGWMDTDGMLIWLQKA